MELRRRRRGSRGPSVSPRAGAAALGAAKTVAPVRSLADQAVGSPRVLADDLVRDLGRQVAELLLDVLRGLRPHAVAVRIVGAPHQRLDAHVLDELGADAVE